MACHVCGCMRSCLRAMANLAPFVRAQVAQHHSQLPTHAELCSLCRLSTLSFFGCQTCRYNSDKHRHGDVATSSTSSTTAITSSCTISATATSATTTSSAIAMTTAIATTSVTATTSGTGAVTSPNEMYHNKEEDAKKKVSKRITVDQPAEKFGKYGLYNYHDTLCCKPCAKWVVHEREDNITHHIHRDRRT